MAATADQLRQEIAQRRDEIGRDLDALGDKVSPGRAVHRRTQRMSARVHRMREAVMGTAEDAGDRLSSSASGAAERVSTTAGEAADAVRQAPEMARERVEGNPLAAGLIAYGFGMLVSSLLPPTRPEQELAGKAQPLVESAVDEAKNVGQEVVADLREPALEAVEQLKGTVTDTAQSVGSHAADAARETASSTSAPSGQGEQRPF
jgi:hypothetical protein